MLLFHYYAVYPAETHEDKNILVCKVVRGQNHKEVSIKKTQKTKQLQQQQKPQRKKNVPKTPNPKPFKKFFKIENVKDKKKHHGKYRSVWWPKFLNHSLNHYL